MVRVTDRKKLHTNTNSVQNSTKALVFAAALATTFVFISLHRSISSSPATSADDASSNILSSTSDSTTGTAASSSCYPKHGLKPLKHRNELGGLLEEHGLKSGIEIGVKQGDFAKELLDDWKTCEKYHLVDLWAKQENYKDIANVDNSTHETFYQEAKDKLESHHQGPAGGEKIEFHRMLSTEAAKKFEKESIDFIYIDARHDYCGVKEDIEHYWPILKPGGIMAGHDYNENSEIRGQDWGLCGDGTRNELAVKGAVNDFFLPKGLTISVTYYRERNFMTWMVQKPLC